MATSDRPQSRGLKQIGDQGVSEYGTDQLTAGFRSMNMLAGLVQRGGRPAAVAPTIPLRDGEKQYGWFPVRVNATGRQVAVITNLRLIVGEDIPLWAITRIQPISGEWSVALDIRNRDEPLVLGGPWVPWMSVVICAELYGTATPPHRTVPAPRRKPGLVAVCPARRGS
jgi:hypothetical protein